MQKRTESLIVAIVILSGSQLTVGGFPWAYAVLWVVAAVLVGINVTWWLADRRHQTRDGSV